MCALHGRKGHDGVWAGRSSYLKVEGVQVSVKQCPHAQGFWCVHPPFIISDLSLWFCHDRSDIFLYTKELMAPAVKVMCWRGWGCWQG